MNKYELVAIVDAQLPTDRKEAINSQTVDAVSKSGGKIINNQLWLDKFKMSFRIKRCNEGSYYLTRFESSTDVVAKIKQVLKVNEDLLRFVIFKSNE